MGKLLDEVRLASNGGPRKAKLISILETLSKEDARDLVKALLDPSISINALTRVLNRRGIEITQNPLREFRIDPKKKALLEAYR